MSTNCEDCGYRDNEVKSGTAISEKGKRITLRCEGRGDLSSRDLLKVSSLTNIHRRSWPNTSFQSKTAGLTIPEINLVLTHGTLSGRFTTVERILAQIYEELGEKAFVAIDSISEDHSNNLGGFLSGLKAVRVLTWKNQRPFTLILNDPIANSYIQNLYAPEELGLNDIKVEGYGKEDTLRLV